MSRFKWGLAILLGVVLIGFSLNGIITAIANRQWVAQVGSALANGLPSLAFESGYVDGATVDITLSSQFAYASEFEKILFIQQLDTEFIATYCNMLRAGDANLVMHVLVRDLTQEDTCVEFLMDRIMVPAICQVERRS